MPKKRLPLQQLEMRGSFVRRHIGPNKDQIQQMLDFCGINNLDEVIAQAMPASILTNQPLALTSTISEHAARGYLRKMRSRNRVFFSMIGMGYYGTLMPSVIKRNVLENPGWYTAYTPYQAEISQGRLEALINFQQMVCDLTAMPLTNASLLDEATSAAEAMAMAKRVSQNQSNLFFIDQDTHPQTIAVLTTRAKGLGFELVIGHPDEEIGQHDYFGILLQYPGSSGKVHDIQSVIDLAHTNSAIVTIATDLLSLVLLKPPGEMDADIVIGSCQRFGVPMGYGGPHAAFFACKEQFKRAIPGRLIGVSVDANGQTAYRMALQTREQHIRRDNATSNICTSQVLLAILVGFYAVYHGPAGLQVIAQRVHRLAGILAEGLKILGYDICHSSFFDTLQLRVMGRARRIAAKARESSINLRVYDADHLGISLDETTRRYEVEILWKIFSSGLSLPFSLSELDQQVMDYIPYKLKRTSTFLTHPVFNLYHSESEMMRYMRRLARKDIALDRAMIPLGSCTMKLNAATEMEAISQREFSALHPFAPLDQTQGYQQLFDELENMLCDLTGFSAFSFQPNAGSQGEYAGLMVIRKFHETKGEGSRHICLIPSSAHGTNPASAKMAGLDIMVVECDSAGNVDIGDLRTKAERYSGELAAFMVTYPSTHGVYEESIFEICQIIHRYGGQVYLDGANFNALVGISRPAEMGADVAHLNLHKTFAIPHGGGGPGVGPIGVKQHLAAFLPNHPIVEGVNPAATATSSIGSVAAAPWGSASILTISWAYIAMMGSFGLRRATLVAILNANYVAKRLAVYFPILYSGKNDFVAHECIIDLRPLKKTSGITVDDIAKRLIDYGFHAPTISFPVPETMMIEPTESENKRELDRFCDAMIAIYHEISEVEEGLANKESNLLKNAPHSHLLLTKQWDLPYSIQRAFFPLPGLEQDKYWPPVGRIDNAFGDRNLVCNCPPITDYYSSAV